MPVERKPERLSAHTLKDEHCVGLAFADPRLVCQMSIPRSTAISWEQPETNYIRSVPLLRQRQDDGVLVVDPNGCCVPLDGGEQMPLDFPEANAVFVGDPGQITCAQQASQSRYQLKLDSTCSLHENEPAVWQPQRHPQEIGEGESADECRGGGRCMSSGMGADRASPRTAPARLPLGRMGGKFALREEPLSYFGHARAHVPDVSKESHAERAERRVRHGANAARDPGAYRLRAPWGSCAYETDKQSLARSAFASVHALKSPSDRQPPACGYTAPRPTRRAHESQTSPYTAPYVITTPGPGAYNTDASVVLPRCRRGWTRGNSRTMSVLGGGSGIGHWEQGRWIGASTSPTASGSWPGGNSLLSPARSVASAVGVGSGSGSPAAAHSTAGAGVVSPQKRVQTAPAATARPFVSTALQKAPSASPSPSPSRSPKTAQARAAPRSPLRTVSPSRSGLIDVSETTFDSDSEGAFVTSLSALDRGLCWSADRAKRREMREEARAEARETRAKSAASRAAKREVESELADFEKRFEKLMGPGGGPKLKLY